MLPCIFARIVLLLTGLLAAAPSVAEQPRIFAAGSLRLAVRQVSGTRFEVLYGPSGKLREKIEQGDVPALFASAAVEHVQILNDKGLLRSYVQFTRNSMCVMARPGVKLDERKLIDTLLDAAVKVGTSTPKADPAGDYTWEVFRKIDRMRPGAYQKLDAKALKLVGSQLSPADNKLPYADLLADGKADVIISYCTNAAAAAKMVAGITWVSFPEAIDVPGLYAIGAARDADKQADDFIAFLTGAEGKKILFSYGFR